MEFKSQPRNVCISTSIAELNFAIEQSATGQQLFNKVAQTLGLRQTQFFGLQFTNKKGLTKWLKMEKKVLSQKVKNEEVLHFKLIVKFYPESVSEELIHGMTKKLFFFHVEERVVKDDIYASTGTLLLLASYSVQAKYGDKNPAVHTKGFLDIDTLLPQRVIGQFLSKEEWEERILDCWAIHETTFREDAMMEYLKAAQDLEMYGMNYFEMRNKRNTDLLLGVDAFGLYIFRKDNKLTPQVFFSWSELREIKWSFNAFIIKPRHRRATKVAFYASKDRIAKEMFNMSVGNHQCFLSRRGPESMEVQIMKMQEEEERLKMEARRAYLQKEKSASEAIESQIRELQAKLQGCEDELSHTHENIRESEFDALAMERNIQAKLKAINDKVEAMKKQEQERLTQLDLIHQENQRKNLSKYLTLKDIRQGNTQARIDMFEAM